MDLWAYYPRRIARLWIPSVVSLVLALMLIVIVGQSADHTVSQWSKTYSFDNLDLSRVVSAMFLITSEYNNPLWSLKWEMIFSLLLPLAFVVVAVSRRWAYGGLALSVGLSTCGAVLNVRALEYLPMFLAGGFVALLIAEHRTPRPVTSWVLVVLGFAMISIPDMYRTFFHGVMLDAKGLALSGLIVLGACAVIRGLAAPSAISGFFASRPFAWLGRISFSLYLVHVPIIIAGIHLFPGPANRSLLLSVPAAVLVAWGFMWAVERPSARLSKRIGSWVAVWRVSSATER